MQNMKKYANNKEIKKSVEDKTTPTKLNIVT